MKSIIVLVLLICGVTRLEATFEIEKIPTTTFRSYLERDKYTGMDDKTFETVVKAIIEATKSHLETRREIIHLIAQSCDEKPQFDKLHFTLTNKNVEPFNDETDPSLAAIDKVLLRKAKKSKKYVYSKSDALSLLGAIRLMHFCDEVLLCFVKSLPAKIQFTPKDLGSVDHQSPTGNILHGKVSDLIASKFHKFIHEKIKPWSKQASNTKSTLELGIQFTYESSSIIYSQTLTYCLQVLHDIFLFASAPTEQQKKPAEMNTQAILGKFLNKRKEVLSDLARQKGVHQIDLDDHPKSLSELPVVQEFGKLPQDAENLSEPELIAKIALLSAKLVEIKRYVYEGMAAYYGRELPIVDNPKCFLLLLNPQDRTQSLSRVLLDASDLEGHTKNALKFLPKIYGKTELKHILKETLREIFYMSLYSRLCIRLPVGDKKLKIPDCNSGSAMQSSLVLLLKLNRQFDHCYGNLFYKAFSVSPSELPDSQEAYGQGRKYLLTDIIGIEYLHADAKPIEWQRYCQWLSMRIDLLTRLTDINFPVFIDPELECRVFSNPQTQKESVLDISTIRLLAGTNNWETKLREHEAQVAELQLGREKLEADLKESKRELDAIREKEANIVAETVELQAQLRDIEASVNATEKKLADTQAESRKKKSEIGELRKEIKRLEDTLQSAKTTVVELEKERESVASTQQEVADIKLHFRAKEEELRNALLESVRLNDKLAKAEKALRKKTAHAQRLEDTLKQKKDALQAEKKAFADTHAAKEVEYKASLAKAEEQRKRLDADKTKLGSKLLDASNALKSKDEENARLTQALAIREQQNNALQNQLVMTQGAMKQMQHQRVLHNVPPAFICGIPVSLPDDSQWSKFKLAFLENPAKAHTMTFEIKGPHGMHYLNVDAYWTYLHTGLIPVSLPIAGDN